jgi:hypothetical protein
MPSVRIPLVGSFNRREPRPDSSAKDQRFRGGLVRVAKNQIAQSITAYFEKRPGISTGSTIDSGNTLYLAKNSINSNTIDHCRVSVSSSTSRVFVGTTLVGVTESPHIIQYITQVSINGEVMYLLAPFYGGSVVGAYYIGETGMSGNATFTADTSNGSAVLANVSSTTGLVIGQKLSGTGIPANTRILTIDSATQVTMTANATATNATVTVTRERMSKIINSVFTAFVSVGPFVEMDGTVYIADADGFVRGSDLNSVSNWTEINKIPADMEADELIGVARYKNHILAFGKKSTEWFFNNGNSSGSLLSRRPEYFSKIGAQASAGPFSQVGDYLFFYGSDGGCYVMDGAAPRKISNEFIDSVLFAGGGYAAVIVDAFYYKGKPLVQFLGTNGGGVSAISSSVSQFWYDIEHGVWVEPNISVSTRIDGSVFSSSPSITIPMAAVTDGKVYAFQSGYEDIGSAFSMVIQLARQDFGSGNRKFLKSIELVADTQASGTTTLEISKDDFATFTTIGTFDMTAAKKIIYRCGSFTGGASLRLTHSANTAWRGEALIVEYDMGVH